MTDHAPANVLLVRLRLIGDVVFTTPAIRAIRRRHPGARLSYVVEPEAEPVIRHNPHLDEVILAPGPRGRRRLVADLALARKLRSRRFDLVLDFHGGPRAAWLAWLTGAPERVGYDITGRRWMYTRVVPRSRELRPRHSVVNQWDLVAALGFPPPDRALDRTEMPADPRSTASVDARLATLGLEPARDWLILLHVSAGNPFRRWPETAFAELVRLLIEGDRRRRIVLTSGPSDAVAARRIGGAARAALGAGSEHTVIDRLDLDLSDLRAIVERAALFIGGDSGPLHVAGTTDVPIVGLYGPTLSDRSAPWRDPAIPCESVEITELACRPCDQRRCVTDDYRCLGWIDAARVAAAAERVLAAAAGAKGA